ncbi:helix-turn-helix domain-containing protein [Mangrovibacillus cuniculi]|uniref:Helix-turn-helix transcriptional regulator n=1 Tax=Mangrovibacillus cuniculi TaxID=2593652 RepID=A0A7S8CCB6_9BACI|nr:helix-turn-helix transcriptional regulator [Mangrovibacillus cuniculi]QPC47365.1 helix-turn-helix transcriptional regulator [Mangrovibacillus cuniculi]
MNKLQIKYIRQMLGLSQQELGHLIGVHNSLISKIETGTANLQPKTEQAIITLFSEKGISDNDATVINALLEKRKAV